MKEDLTSTLDAFQRLVEIVAQLRDPKDGCPWDVEQTHESLRQYLIEEAHEVVESITEAPEDLQYELGDVLLQVLLHSQIAKEDGRFAIVDVIKGITEKMISRHPHVFGDVTVKTSADVLKNWEKRKQDELPEGRSILDGVPVGMPALLRAQRLGEKAARVGFDWQEAKDVVAKIKEELGELEEALTSKDANQEALAEELGDLLFALAQYSRKLGLVAEDTLQAANRKFTERFKAMEQSNGGAPLDELSNDKLEELWEEVKDKFTPKHRRKGQAENLDF